MFQFQFALIETISTALMDRFPHLRAYKFWVVLVMCITGYCAGLPLCTRVLIYADWLLTRYLKSHWLKTDETTNIIGCGIAFAGRHVYSPTDGRIRSIVVCVSAGDS